MSKSSLPYIGVFLFSHFAEIMNDVIRATTRQHNKQAGRMEWRVLVVDGQVREARFPIHIFYNKLHIFFQIPVHEDGLRLHQDAGPLCGGDHQ